MVLFTHLEQWLRLVARRVLREPFGHLCDHGIEELINVRPGFTGGQLDRDRSGVLQ